MGDHYNNALVSTLVWASCLGLTCYFGMFNELRSLSYQGHLYFISPSNTAGPVANTCDPLILWSSTLWLFLLKAGTTAAGYKHKGAFVEASSRG